jgi:hypothetical protein
MTGPLPIRLGLLCAVWFLTIGAGIAMVLRYENTSGTVGATAQHWPSVTQVALDPKRDTLVMFGHPKCPCTRATVGELNRLMAQGNGRVVAHVFFLQPAGFSDDWVRSGLWHDAAAIPGVTVQADPQGLIGQKFGAETSGYVLLYNPAGQLLFSGGITSGRGHAGDNAGEDAIIALVNGQNSGVTHTLVYGCSLLSEPGTQECLSNECTYSTKP